MRDIDKDVLMMFVLSYEYSMSFTNLVKLFKISKEYFWTFMEICSPMLKMGVRKASMIRKSVNKIYSYLVEDNKEEDLTLREENILELFRCFLEDSFSNGEGCLDIEQLKDMPFAKGYNEHDLCVASNYKSLKDNLDMLKYVKIGDEKYHKTSKMLYYMEKYCGDLDFYQINNLTLKDMQRKISDGEERVLHEEVA